MEAAASSSYSLFGDNQNQILHQYSSTSTISSSSTAPTEAPQKKRRNQPGTPNPDAEVVALSPRTLVATNRFICEVCNKGFQREQNLQLHRRGHNLPWKLKQKTSKEVKKKVYICPELTCVHHDPSRALGDLTGIKKHFFRKHGDKKWKCEKCSKRYAVQSDLKAHSKICGTKEYRCDCGTLFSRRDSYITHRAFCEALSQENATRPTSLSTTGNHLYGNTNRMSISLSHMSNSHIPSLQHPNNMLKLESAAGGAKLEHLIPPPPTNESPLQAYMQDPSQLGYQDHQHNHDVYANKGMHQHGLVQLPDDHLQTNTESSPSSANNLFNIGFFTNSGNSSSGMSSSIDNSGFLRPIHFGNTSTGGQGTTFVSNNMRNQAAGSAVSPLFSPSLQHGNNISAHMSATALLQKAAQMGTTTTGNGSIAVRGLANPKSYNAQLVMPTNFGGEMESDNNLQGLMSTLVNEDSSGNIFGVGGLAQNGNAISQFNGYYRNFDEAKLHQNMAVSIGRSDKLTLDFLGVGGMVGGSRGFSEREQEYDISANSSSLDKDMKSSQASHPFGRA